ncbi:MAG TPA: phosphoribosylglycinamide formyltransferase, partial [Paenibacillaceae bacterium]|nr:phosphoribosylglycinamide formyltransferase [Paenibacillaceae bacterium]
MMKLAVFASGSGSNFGAIMEAIRDQRIQGAEIVLLVCDKPGAYVLERAASYEVPTFVFSAKDYPNKVAFETEILRQLDEAGV